jgi:hypothetical protein
VLWRLLEKLGVVSPRPVLSSAVEQSAGTRARASVPLVLLPSVPSQDAWEGWYDWQSRADLPVAVEAEIRYTDGIGQDTLRRISTKRFEDGGTSGDGMIVAHYHMRRGNRTFKVSRIKEFIDVSTGEIVGDIPAYLRASYDVSSIGRTVRALRENSDPLTVLLYIARADARLSPKEKSVLIRSLRRTIPDVQLDAARIDSAWSEGPPQTALKRALKAVRENGEADILLEYVEALATARLKMDDFTDAAVTLVRKRLAKLKGQEGTLKRRSPEMSVVALNPSAGVKPVSS